jgi:hypothetical protein
MKIEKRQSTFSGSLTQHPRETHGPAALACGKLWLEEADSGTKLTTIRATDRAFNPSTGRLKSGSHDAPLSQ